MKRAQVRQRPFLLIGLGSALVLTGVAGCASPDTPEKPAVQREPHYQEIARLYREGQYEKVVLGDLLPYFHQRTGQMTVADLKRLLGEPRVVTPESCWYRDALSSVYGWGHIEDPDRDRPEGKHDQVLVYGEMGPPDHWIADESSSLWFVTKDGIVIGVWELG